MTEYKEGLSFFDNLSAIGHYATLNIKQVIVKKYGEPLCYMAVYPYGTALNVFHRGVALSALEDEYCER